MMKPDVVQTDGLSPAISIEQKTTSCNPRSTVGTATEIYDAAAVHKMVVSLFAGDGAADREPDGHSDGGPDPRAAGGNEAVSARRSCGVARASTARSWKTCSSSSGSRSTASFTRSTLPPALGKKFKHDIDVVVDRLVVKRDLGNRLADLLETALRLADGLAIAEFADRPRRRPTPRRRAPTNRRTKPSERSSSERARLPGVGVHHRRDRAAAVLVQQSVRRLPEMRRPRHRAWCSRRISSFPTNR